MLELDLLLKKFCDNYINDLDEQGLNDYQDLLECSDQELFGWFFLGEVPKDQAIKTLVGFISNNCK